MDIDIDLSPDFSPFDLFEKITPASRIENGQLEKHLVGIYFQNIPKDSITEYAAIPYKEAEQVGYTKIDFLHLTFLENFKSKAEIREYLKKEPDWSILEDEETVKKLFHISKHFDIVFQVKPRSVMELADVLALIRPGKRKLLDKYLRNPEVVRQELHTKVQKSDLRLAHSIPYAMIIVLNMHLISENKL